MHVRRSISALMICALTCAVGGPALAADPVVPPAPAPASPWSASVLAGCAHPVASVARFPLRRRVAQLVMAGVDATDPLARSSWITRDGIGGILLKGLPSSGERLGSSLASLKALDPWVPPLVAVDEEGGRVQLLRKITDPLPSARRLGQRTADDVRTLVAAHGRQVRGFGIDMVFGPVLDVTASRSGVIGDRSFSGDPAVVSAIGSAYAAGLRDAGLIPVVKHFPGHGSASGDSHTGRVQTPDAASVIERDAAPFRAVLASGPAAVMVAHVEVPGLTGSRPASVSRRAITWLLRIKFGFQGLVITDSLTMGAVNLRWPPGQAAVQSVKAGADIAAFVSIDEVTSVVDALEAAVRDHTLDEGQVNRSVVRILRTKGVNPCTVAVPTDVGATPGTTVGASTSAPRGVAETLPGGGGQ